MRIPTSRDRGEVRDDRSMTAMIDVVFLLLIFFVCASIGQMGELLVSTELSGASIDAAEFQEQPKPRGEVWVFMRRDKDQVVVQVNEGGTEYRGKAGELRKSPDYPKLVAQFRGLAKIDADIPVIFDNKPEVYHGDELLVHQAAKNAGFQKINLVAESKPKPAGP